METLVSDVQGIEKKFVTAVHLDLHHAILYLSLAAALFFGVYIWQGRRIDVAEGKTAVAVAVAAQAKEDAAQSAKDNAALQASLALQISQLNEANKTLSAANESLANAVKAEAAALAAQQKKDSTLTPTELSARWTLLVPAAKVVPTTAGYEVNAAGGLATVQELEKVPVLTGQLLKDADIITNQEHIIGNSAEILSREQASHRADVENDGKQLVASQLETKKVQSEFDTYKKKARRNIMRAFAAGVVTGVVIKKFLGF